MKNYDDVKKASEQAVYELAKTIRGALEAEEADKLMMELAMTFYALTIDFDLPIDDFIDQLNNTNLSFSLSMSEHLLAVKEAIDKGEIENEK